MSVKIYVEGGGDTNPSRAKCRKGFSTFLEKAGLGGRMPKIIACGSRQKAFDKFCTAFSKAKDNEFIILLVDSEGPVSMGISPWSHLKDRDNWPKPQNTTDDNVHLMVQIMETWFFADKNSLSTYFGSNFSEGLLPDRSDIENIPKEDINSYLERATHLCHPKQGYHKGRDSFSLLAGIDPGKLTKLSPYAKRLVDLLLEKSV